MAFSGCAAGDSGAVPVAPAVSPAATTDETTALRSFSAMPEYERVAEPVRLSIPRIGVTSGLERLARAEDRTLQVPQDPQSAGWYTEGARPGERGPAVLLGHVDSGGGPAVFYRLHELVPGDEVVVESADGSQTTFLVTRVEQHAKSAFPTDVVYSPTAHAEVRLITCGGAFDAASKHYRDNVIVFATLST